MRCCMDDRKRIIWQSLMLTFLIFVIGILLNHVLDYVRIDSILDVMQEHELDRESYQVEYLFAKNFNSNTCAAMVSRIGDLKREMRKVGEDLSTYSRFSFFKRRDFDYLKRRYFLLQLRFFSLIERANEECGNPYVPILYFYRIDDDASERQGFMLQEASEEYEESVVVLSLDLDYEDEPLVGLLAETYGVTRAPTIIVDDQKFEGLAYTGELRSAILRDLREPDPYAEYDMNFTVRASGIDYSLLVGQLRSIAENSSADMFARADARLALGRITHNGTMICSSLELFDKVVPSSYEEQALLYETSASLGCGRNRRAFLHAAAEEWEKAGYAFRADFVEALSTGYLPDLVFDDAYLDSNLSGVSGYLSPVAPNVSLANASGIVIGSTALEFPRNASFLVQVDRVHRDWLGGQLQNPFNASLLRTFSERLYYDEAELLPDIGWHEGARSEDLVDHGLSYSVSPGILVARLGDRWFAVDDQGVFRFEVPLDKLLYPTTRFLHKDVAVIVDTHGVNMLVEPALRYDVSFVMGCCDHPSKVYAAEYLSDHDVSVLCYTDKYLYLLAGHDVDVVGSPPVSFNNDSVVFGDRPVSISVNDTVVAVNASDDVHALWYYQSPASYFSVFDDVLDVSYVTLDGFGQMDRAIFRARDLNATVLATRVFNRGDYDAVSSWLRERPENTAILFHSASYPFGQVLFAEFPDQTSFDDPNPVIV